MKYELRKIDAWRNDEEGWWWNDSYEIDRCEAEDVVEACIKLFETNNITFRVDVYHDYYAEDSIEIRNAETGEPLLAIMPLNA